MSVIFNNTRQGKSVRRVQARKQLEDGRNVSNPHFAWLNHKWLPFGSLLVVFSLPTGGILFPSFSGMCSTYRHKYIYISLCTTYTITSFLTGERESHFFSLSFENSRSANPRSKKMALSVSSCLNHFHPIPNSSTKSQATQLPCRKEEKERSWKRQCMIGAACIILGFPISENLPAVEINLIALGGGGDHHHRHHHHHIALASSSESKVGKRWSEKRSCPPWHINSLETIVPENLPRPSARRRWEATGFSETETSAPSSSSVVVVVPPKVSRTAANYNYSAKCFSL